MSTIWETIQDILNTSPEIRSGQLIAKVQAKHPGASKRYIYTARSNLRTWSPVAKMMKSEQDRDELALAIGRHVLSMIENWKR